MTISQLQFIEFNPETATDKHFDDIVAIQLEEFVENNPNDTPPTAEYMRKRLEQLKDNPIFEPHAYLVYDDEDNAIGTVFYGYAHADSPDYEEQKNMAYIGVRVRPDYRRQGYGTQLLKFTAHKMQEQGKTLIQGETDHDNGRAFAEVFGARVAIEGRENRLYVADIDWEMVEAWAQTGKTNNPDVTLEMFEGLPSDEDMEAYSQLYTEVFNQQPLDESEGLELTFTPERIRAIHKQMQARGTMDYVMFTREANGALSGLTELAYTPERGHRIGQGLTGVQSAYRGRGLGKWLKAQMLLFMRDTFPDVEFVSTSNANSNGPMLSINERLGFQAYKHNTLYKIKLADLLQQLESK